MPETICDLVIAGAGPAGITASVYAARKGMSLKVLTLDIGGQTVWTGNIENYTGYQFVTGAELGSKFQEHIDQYKIDVKLEEPVTGVEKKGDLIYVFTGKGVCVARSFLIATGKRANELGVPGEKEFKNKGIAYCATCDGPFFAGKDVVVVGGGNSALEAALQLSKIAGRLYIVNISSELTGDKILIEKLEKDSSVAILNRSEVVAVTGDNFVGEVVVKTGDKEQTIGAQGVFVEIGLSPNTSFKSPVELNELGEIKVNTRNETNIPGIFAAGDVTDIHEKQIIIAAGEGAKAALSAYKYVSRLQEAR